MSRPKHRKTHVLSDKQLRRLEDEIVQKLISVNKVIAIIEEHTGMKLGTWT